MYDIRGGIHGGSFIMTDSKLDNLIKAVDSALADNNKWYLFTDTDIKLLAESLYESNVGVL